MKSDAFLLISLCALILFFGTCYFILPQKSFSENENRLLHTFPAFSLGRLWDGSFSRGVHDFYADQIVFRDQMIATKAVCELLLLKRENNGVILHGNGYLIENPRYTERDYANLEKNLLKISSFESKLSNMGISTYKYVVPSKKELLLNSLPHHLSGEDAFYKTDHHWNARGAYLAYLEIAKMLEISPIDYEDFNVSALSEDFFGTSYSKSGFFFTLPDTLSAPKIEEGKYKTTIVDINRVIDGLYELEFLSKKDKYAVFFGGNYAHVSVVDTKESKETLLIIKDSFAHSLAPYLCAHFNLEIIDPRYYTSQISKFITENNIKKVLFLFGIDTLISSNIYMITTSILSIP